MKKLLGILFIGLKEEKKLGKNVEHHIVKGEHSVRSTLLKNDGFEILKEVLK